VSVFNEELGCAYGVVSADEANALPSNDAVKCYVLICLNNNLCRLVDEVTKLVDLQKKEVKNAPRTPDILGH